MKFIQPLILVLLLSLCANTAFAADKADCYRIDSQEKVSVCANEILQDAPFIGPMLDALKTKYSTYFASAIANTLLSNDDKDVINLTYDEDKENTLTKYRDVFGKALQFFFLFVGTAYCSMAIYKTQFTGEFLGTKQHDFVYLAFKFVVVYYLLGLGGLFDLVAGAVLASVLLATSFIVWATINIVPYLEVDKGSNTTRAEALARDNVDSIIQVMIQNEAANILFQSKMLNKNNFSSVVNGKRVYTESVYSKCMEQDAEPNRFLATLLLSGETRKSQKCLKEGLGFKEFSLGSVSYSGQDESTRQALIQMTDMAHFVAYDTIKYMCDTALNVDDRRAKWSENATGNPRAYNECLNRSVSGGVAVGEGGAIEFYPANSGVSKASIQAQIEEMRKVLVGAATSYVDNHSKEAINLAQKPLTNMMSFILDMATVSKVAGNLEDGYSKEFTTSISVESSPLMNASGSMAGLTQELDKTEINKVWDETKVIRIFDIDRTIRVLTQQTDSLLSDKKLQNGVEYLSNLILGDLFSVSGFTFEDCTKAVNTCVAPVLNQSAALFQNGMKSLKVYWTVFVVGKIAQTTLDNIDSAKTKAMARTIGALNFATGLAISACALLLVLGGVVTPLVFLMRYAAVITSLTATLLIFTYKLLGLLSPFPSNMDHEKAHVTLLDLVLVIVWKVLEQVVIIILFVIAIGIHSIVLVIVGMSVYAIVLPMLSNDSSLAMLTGLIFSVLIFQYLCVHVQIKIASTLMALMDSMEKMFKVQAFVNAANDSVEGYQKVAGKFRDMNRKVFS